MKALAEAPGLLFEWTEPRADEEYFEWQAGGETFGFLRFPSPLGAFAEAGSPEGEWTFHRADPLETHITVRDGHTGQDLAVFRPGLMGRGHLAFRDGADFQWKPVDFGNETWAFLDRHGRPVVQFDPPDEEHPRHGACQACGAMEFNPKARTDRDALLSVLGLYLKALHLRDAAALANAAEAGVA